MKTLKNPQVTVTGNRITIVADIVDVNYDHFVTQRVTIGHSYVHNLSRPRQIQVSNQAIFVKNRANGVAFATDALVEIAKNIDPTTSYAPVFKKSISPTFLTAVIGSELDVTYQWQAQDPKTNQFENIAGTTSATLTDAPKKVFIQCIATNAAGSTTSNMIQTV